MQQTPAVRPPLRRLRQGRQLAGVCAGLADHLGLHPNALRVGFALLALVGGIGFIVYGFLWATVPEEEPAPGEQLEPATTRARLPDSVLWLIFVGAALMVAGGVIGLELFGLNLRLDITVPVVVIGLGAAFAWSQLDEATRRRWAPGDGAQGKQAVTRLAIGVAMAVVGLIILSSRGQGISQLWDVGIAVLIVLLGVSLITAPYVMRLWRDLRAEQTERIRATERADIAAHLHDSVLQTLALIQRQSDDPGQVTRLARAQERELRSWLYAGPPGDASTLASAVTAAGNEVEDMHGVPIELIVTGDRPLSSGGNALVSALREAMVNAVRHGAPPVSAYVEVGPVAVEAFVRDHGAGFDPDAVPGDRLGVRESILGRMRRHGGTAAVRRLEDGTEVSLRLPVTDPHTVEQDADAAPHDSEGAP